MAVSTIDDAYLFVLDRCPGPIQGVMPPADKDGNIFTNAEFHNTETQKFPLGAKWYVENATFKGFSVFSYLQFGAAPGVACAVKSPCGYCSAATANFWRVANDPDELDPIYAAFALSAMTDNYFGFFWTGGPCPVDHVSGLNGNYKTNNVLVIGPWSIGDAVDTDETALVPVLDNDAAIAETELGYTLANDA